MTPREALYNLVMELGPVPVTTRDDNLSPEEIRLRDSVKTLQTLCAQAEAFERAMRDNYIAGGRDDVMALYCEEASKH